MIGWRWVFGKEINYGAPRGCQRRPPGVE